MYRHFRMILMLAMFVFAASAFAEVQCDVTYNSKAYSDAQYNFCWLSGSVCYQCYDVQTADSCSSEYTPCNPYPRRFDKNVVATLFPEEKPASPCVAAAFEQKQAQLRIDNLL
jgi:hypothetical protein